MEEATAGSSRFIGLLQAEVQGAEAADAHADDAQKYRDLMEALGVAVYTTDAAGIITSYNQAAAELWGRHPHIGKDLWCGSWRILHTDGNPMPHDQCPMATCLKQNRPVRGIEAIAERPDGKRVHFLPFPTPLRDTSGQLVGAVNVLVDITERKLAQAEAEQQRELVHAVIETVSVGLLLLDEQGRIEYMNPAAERITGYAFEEIRGEVAHDKLHYLRADGSPFPKSECPIHAVTDKPPKVVDQEDIFVRPNGSLYNVVRNITPVVRAGGKFGHVVDLRDATAEKRAEEAIRHSIHMKDQFLGLVSHELRTPITVILGNTRLLQRRGDKLPEEDKEQALGDIAMEAERLQRIIENLLLLTRIENGQYVDAEPIRLQPLIAQAVHVFQRRNQERPVEVICDEIPIVLGQPTFLSLVLDNLISNADKYSPVDAPIQILMRSGSPDDVEVCVRDYGIGLDSEDVEQLFTPFYRSTRATSHAKGIGLGLAVCKRVLEAQDGTIRAVARPEGGCDFIFTVKRYQSVSGLYGRLTTKSSRADARPSAPDGSGRF